MSRNFSIFIIILALLPIIIFLFTQPQELVQKPFEISHSDKQILLDYSYDVLYSYFNESNDYNIETYTSLNNPDLNYNIVFITLLQNGKVKGCQSGSTEKNEDYRLFKDIKEAVVESIEDERFQGVIKKENLQDIEIMFTFLYNVNWLYNTTEIFLENNIELGVHAIEILHNNTPVIFKESVPISNNYNLSYTLDRLCIKANLNNKCYQDEDVDLFRYDTFTFMGTKDDKIVDLYRYNILINKEDITQSKIYQSINNGYDWFLHSVNNHTGRLEYEYYPSQNFYSPDNNHVRQLATLWSITELTNFLHDNQSNALITSMLDYYLSFQNETDKYLYITIGNESKLANNAFLILTLLNQPAYPDQQLLLNRLGRGILSLQQENGSFNTYFFSDKNTGVDYYPGEAMLSLMKLYTYTSNESYLNAVEKAFAYYKYYWQNNKNTAFIPWHTQAYALLYQETKDSQLVDFIFEMNDWMIDNYQIQSSLYPDEIGGFPYYYPTFSTSVFIEGINDAYNIARFVSDTDHINKYKSALQNGIRFILQTQFTDNNSFYLENDYRAIGGFKTSLTDNSIRIDNTQHAVMALMKSYQNQIYND